MYIQITDNCNMSCGHCGFYCSPRKRKFMSTEIFGAAINFSNTTEDIISIGGGEPTCHPKFWEFLIFALSKSNSEIPIWMATNGKKTEDAIRLFNLAKKGIISCELSVDDYHEPIDWEVVKMFKKKKWTRTVKNIANIGRGRKISESFDMCICSVLFCDPNGDLWSCGCKKHKFGNVLSDNILWSDINSWSEKRNASIGECVFAERRTS